MAVPSFTMIFWCLAALFAGNAGFYLFEIIHSPKGLKSDPGNTFGMFADFGIAVIFFVLGIVAIVQHKRFAKD